MTEIRRASQGIVTESLPVQPAREVLTPSERVELGKQLIETTLEKYGLVLIVRPVFLPRDDGTWSIVVRSEIQARTKE